MKYRRYTVSRRDKEPLLGFITRALESSGCRIVRASKPDNAPFRITFEDPGGIRHGILVYAFLANAKPTKNRPEDEHRFQVKYGTKDGELHEIWQDPFLLYTTLMVGIDLERGLFVAVDPMMHRETKFFISVEFKREHVEAIQDQGWNWWERDKRQGEDTPVEVMVGGRPERFLDFVRFEQAARGMDQGHRYLLAENLDRYQHDAAKLTVGGRTEAAIPNRGRVHELAKEFEISEDEILGMIQAAPRLKMAVRGWVAERHLEDVIQVTSGIDRYAQLEEDGRPDFEVSFRGSGPIFIECKNVLRQTTADGTQRVDFQKTRAAKGDPCSRFYRPEDFEILAACLHPCTEAWDFAFQRTAELEPHKKCEGRLSNLVRINERWSHDLFTALESL